MTNDPIRQTTHDLHNHLHALEMGIVALSAANDALARQTLGEALQQEIRGAKQAALRLVEVTQGDDDRDVNGESAG